MKKLSFLIGVSLLISIVFFVCNSEVSKLPTKDQYISENKLTDNIIIREIDIAKLKNKDLIKNINDISLKKGVYKFDFTNENKSLILFNGIDGYYSDIRFTIKNKTLTISYKYIPDRGIHKKSMFMTEDKNNSFDTVLLLKDGESDVFNTIYGM